MFVYTYVTLENTCKSFQPEFSKLQPMGQKTKNRNNHPPHGLLPISVNKVLLKHIHTYLFIYSLWLLFAAIAELSSCDRDCMVCKAKIFIIWVFMEKVCIPCSKQVGLKNQHS